MKLEIGPLGHISVDLRRKGSYSSTEIYEDGTTSISVGRRCVRVTLKDHCLTIDLPSSGDREGWEDPDYAREEAINKLLERLDLETFLRILEQRERNGFKKGSESRALEVRTALGIP